MEIKRKIGILIQTRRKFVIRQSPEGELGVCAECGETMLSAEQTAALLAVSHRRIFQLVELGAGHFTETDVGALFVCPNSLVEFISNQTPVLKGENL
ncbi:MAG TPA: hypothetical protein VK308_10330 [Pyrinomonadaceae bacterium]|nr:hypothetical protein [Pyrinomonadaceae bacterium]